MSARLKTWTAIVAVVVLAACGTRENTAADDGTAAQTAPSEGASTAGGATAADDATDEPEAKAENYDEMLAFCVKNYETILADCADDQAFWDPVSTFFFNTDPQLAENPAAKPEWVRRTLGMMTAMHKRGELSENCATSLKMSQNPTAAQMKRVAAARELSCGEFGNAWGWMVFGEGAFFLPNE